MEPVTRATLTEPNCALDAFVQHLGMLQTYRFRMPFLLPCQHCPLVAILQQGDAG